MSPSYKTIVEYQRLVKNVIKPKFFLLPNMKYQSIKYEVVFWKIRKTKIAHFRRHFPDRILRNMFAPPPPPKKMIAPLFWGSCRAKKFNGFSKELLFCLLEICKVIFIHGKKNIYMYKNCFHGFQ